MTQAQIEFFERLLAERENPKGWSMSDFDESANPGAMIGFMKKQAPIAGTKAAKAFDAIASVQSGEYKLTAKQAATVLNYKGEQYFEAGAVTLKVSHAKSGAYWVERTGKVSHPIKDRKASAAIMHHLSGLFTETKTTKKVTRSTKEIVSI